MRPSRKLGPDRKVRVFFVFWGPKEKAAGAGLSVFPCFVGDSDERLVRVAAPIAELTTEQWLVTHHEERHAPAIRLVSERIAKLMAASGPLFRGEMPIHGQSKANQPASTT